MPDMPEVKLARVVDDSDSRGSCFDVRVGDELIFAANLEASAFRVASTINAAVSRLLAEERRKVVEEASLIASEEGMTRTERYNHPLPGDIPEIQAHKAMTAYKIAEKIRALAPKGEKKWGCEVHPDLPSPFCPRCDQLFDEKEKALIGKEGK